MVHELLTKLKAGDRYALARSITLVESERIQDRQLAHDLMIACEQATPSYWSIAVTGSPGVGKSTFIEQLGVRLLDDQSRVAILAVDPASNASHGSILGDKTRMATLSQNENVFIRPSSNRSSYGGVGPNTWESMLLCATAGYDHIIIETVGVGQSEVDVAQFADFVVLMLQPGAGDELQGLKRGILEIAHLLIVNKFDGDQRILAEQTYEIFSKNLIEVEGFQQSLHKVSALKGTGMEELYTSILNKKKETASSERTKKNSLWFRERVERLLLELALKQYKDSIANLAHQIMEGQIGAASALDKFSKDLLHQNDL